jgi:hypothetical protein
MMTYNRHPKHDFTLFISEGNTTIDEWLDTVGRYSARGISRLELYDLRSHTNLFSNDEIEQLLIHALDNSNIRPKNNKTALLVNQGVLYGLSRMYESLAKIEGIENNETEVFDNLEGAVEWLGEQAKAALGDYD